MKNYNWDQLLSPRKVTIMLSAVVILWSLNLLIIKYLTNYFPPIALAGIRLSIAASLLLPIALRYHGFIKLPLTSWLQIITVGFFSIFMHQITLSWGVSKTSATHSVLILSLIPLFTTLLASMFINEPLSKNKIFSLLLGLSGVFIIINPANNSAASSLIGDSVIFIAAIAYVIGSLFVKKSATSAPLLVLTTYSHVFAAIGLLLLGFFVNKTWYYPNAISLWPLTLIFFSAIVCTAGGAICWNTGTKIIGASQTSLFLNIQPIFGVFASALLLGEQLTWQHFISLALVLLGISLGTGVHTMILKPQSSE